MYIHTCLDSDKTYYISILVSIIVSVFRFNSGVLSKTLSALFRLVLTFGLSVSAINGPGSVSNWPAQLQKLARVLEICDLASLDIHYAQADLCLCWSHT